MQLVTREKTTSRYPWLHYAIIRKRSPTVKRIYLAGPEVFLKDAALVFRRKKEICQEHFMIGVSPMDGCPPIVNSKLDTGIAIFQHCFDELRSCNAVIANISPFRGHCCDTGTAVEIGMARALGKPIFAYTNCGPEEFRLLRRMINKGDARIRPNTEGVIHEDEFGAMVENFGTTDNIMVDCSVLTSSGVPVQFHDGKLYSRLALGSTEVFRKCVEAVAVKLSAKNTPLPNDPYAELRKEVVEKVQSGDARSDVVSKLAATFDPSKHLNHPETIPKDDAGKVIVLVRHARVLDDDQVSLMKMMFL